MDNVFILYCWASDDDVEIEKYQQQTVADTHIETGQPSLPSLPLLRPLTANKTSDTCRETQPQLTLKAWPFPNKFPQLL